LRSGGLPAKKHGRQAAVRFLQPAGLQFICIEAHGCTRSAMFMGCQECFAVVAGYPFQGGKKCNGQFDALSAFAHGCIDADTGPI
jgi:hypothetical protein